MIIINNLIHPVIIFVTFQYFTILICCTRQNGIKVQEVKLKIEVLKLFGVYLRDKVLEIG